MKARTLGASDYSAIVLAGLFMPVALIALLYFTPRPNFVQTYALFLFLFAGYFMIIFQAATFPLRVCIGLAIFWRLLALWNLPVLSDDYFRFIWDGKMILAHVSPYRYTPTAYLAGHPQDAYWKFLLTQMNSADYKSVYPPVLQGLFAVAVWLFPTKPDGAVLIMKTFIFLSECLTIQLLYIYLRKKKMSVRNVLWYALNPLMIVELVGNVHFEGVLLCFFMAMLLYLETKQHLLAGLLWALAIATKLTPLMLAPLLCWNLGWRKFVSVGGTALIVTGLLFAPFFYWQVGADIGSSLRLFYHLFEFNAPVFYLIRTIANYYVDYDVIEEVAPKLGVLSFFIILAISCWPRGNRTIEGRSLWIYAVYFLFATMVHPWYISILVLLSVCNKFRFPVVFSLLIPLSYFPYSLKNYEEDMRIILLEYGLLAIFMLVEWRWIKRTGHSPLDWPRNPHSTPN